MNTAKQFCLGVSAIVLLHQQAMAAPMPPEWGAIKTAAIFEDGCPNISGDYANNGEMSKGNPSHYPYDTHELDSLLSHFYARPPDPMVKFVIQQHDSQTIETLAVGTAGETVKGSYVRGDSDREGNNNYTCETNAIALKEHIEYSGEQGRGVTDVKTKLMLAADGALIVHQTIRLKLTSLLIFTSIEITEYWWRFARKK